jgi:hypothetical protein
MKKRERGDKWKKKRNAKRRKKRHSQNQEKSTKANLKVTFPVPYLFRQLPHHCVVPPVVTNKVERDVVGLFLVGGAQEHER